MRGKQRFDTAYKLFVRITPADAGKTMKEVPCVCVEEDHPRGCGENSDKDLLNFFKSGSPPRMRGKQYMNDSKKALLRITPADAGKTTVLSCTL